MVNCCVNPDCTAEHKLLRIGDVYAIERPGAKTEYVWMCSTCACSFDVSLDPMGVAGLSRRTDKPQPPPPAGFSFCLVEQGARGIPLQRTGSSSAQPVIEHSGDRGK